MKINNKKIKSLILLSLVGSGLGKENNHTEIAHPKGINLNLLPQIAVNLTKREDNPDELLIFAGYPIVLMDDRNRENTKNCTLGFAVLYNDSPDCDFGDSFPSGFLTSSLCSPIADSENNIVRTLNWDKSEHLGDIIYATFGNSITDTDYAFTSIFNQNRLIPYTVITETSNDKTVNKLYPVVGTSLSQPGIICAYGSSSGYHCGNQVESDLEITIPNPWSSGSTITFKGLNKIDLGTSGFENEEDHGGPVFLVGSSPEKEIITAALGHITWFDNSDPNHKLVYYTPIDKVLSAILKNNDCSYNLLTHSEPTNEQFQAQTSIPPKK
jgi:hypothetical protein